MPVTFENDNDVKVYALECVISYARRTQQIFVAQCVWWLASVLGLEKKLVSHINKLQRPKDTTLQERLHREVSTIPSDLANDQRIDQVLDNTEKYLRESKRLREIAALKVSGKTITDRINPSKISKKYLKKSERKSKITMTNLLGEILARRKGLTLASFREGKQQASAFAALGPPIGKAVIELRIADNKLNLPQVLKDFLRCIGN